MPVIDGHTESVHVRLDGKADATEARTAMEKFKGLPQELGLPSAPPKPVIVRDEEDRPQPRLDVMAGNGMSTVVGRLRQGVDESSLAFTLVSHNLVRGAAGAAEQRADDRPGGGISGAGDIQMGYFDAGGYDEVGADNRSPAGGADRGDTA